MTIPDGGEVASCVVRVQEDVVPHATVWRRVVVEGDRSSGSLAWLLSNASGIGAAEGLLEVRDRRLTFRSIGGDPTIDLPLSRTVDTRGYLAAMSIFYVAFAGLVIGLHL